MANTDQWCLSKELECTATRGTPCDNSKVTTGDNSEGLVHFSNPHDISKNWVPGSQTEKGRWTDDPLHVVVIQLAVTSCWERTACSWRYDYQKHPVNSSRVTNTAILLFPAIEILRSTMHPKVVIDRTGAAQSLAALQIQPPSLWQQVLLRGGSEAPINLLRCQKQSSSAISHTNLDVYLDVQLGSRMI